VGVLRRQGRLPALLGYLDGLLLVPVRINVGKMFLLRSSGTAGRMAIPDFQVALQQEPVLYDEWIAALRLSARRGLVRVADDLAGLLLEIGMSALAGGYTGQEL